MESHATARSALQHHSSRPSSHDHEATTGLVRNRHYFNSITEARRLPTPGWKIQAILCKVGSWEKCHHIIQREIEEESCSVGC